VAEPEFVALEVCAPGAEDGVSVGLGLGGGSGVGVGVVVVGEGEGDGEVVLLPVGWLHVLTGFGELVDAAGDAVPVVGGHGVVVGLVDGDPVTVGVTGGFDDAGGRIEAGPVPFCPGTVPCLPWVDP
jgi:hypothetical protein